MRKFLLATTLFFASVLPTNAMILPPSELNLIREVNICRYALDIWRHDVIGGQVNTALVKVINRENREDVKNLIIRTSALFDMFNDTLPKELRENGYGELYQTISDSIDYGSINSKIMTDFSYSKELLTNCVKLTEQ